MSEAFICEACGFDSRKGKFVKAIVGERARLPVKPVLWFLLAALILGVIIFVVHRYRGILSGEELLRRQQEQAEWAVTSWVDEHLPPWNKGDAVTVLLKNGRVVEGTLVDFDGTRVHVASDDISEEVSLTQCVPAMQLRLCPDVRSRYIERRVKIYMDEQPELTNPDKLEKVVEEMRKDLQALRENLGDGLAER